MRLAWFSPWPPQRSGIAGRSAEVVPLLAARGHGVDVLIDATIVRATVGNDDGPKPGEVRVVSAHDFLWRQTRGLYDLPVYQIGNSHLHRYIWPYLFRYPGLAVLHDARLHHARAEALISRGRYDHYRAEFAWNHPSVPTEGAELAILGYEGAFYYQWPMVRSVVGTARLTASHSRGVADQLAQEWPGCAITHVALGEGPASFDVAAASRDFRLRHGIDAGAIVFGVHGGLTEEKRIPDILNAFAVTRAWIPHAHLLLVGADDPLISLRDRLSALNLDHAVTHIASADNAEFDRSIAASDVTINLRWPSALETSGPWVRSLALGRPTITIAAAHQSHVPSLDPLSWQPHQPSADLAPDPASRAVTVGLELLNLNQGLRAAMRRLGDDRALRDRMGHHARLWWEQEHTVERMVSDYERAFALALASPMPSQDRPAHLTPDPTTSTRELLGKSGWSDPLLWERLDGVVS
jgi:glycosyltransferase involved in cell wall biosynthesis